MTVTTAQTSPLAKYRAADSARRRAAVQRALAAMVAAGDFVSVSEVARRAGVHRSFIYRHPDLHAQIQNHPNSGTPAPVRADRITTASLKAVLANEQDRNRRLAQRLRQLEHRLSEALGREAFHAAGLASIDETRDLQIRIQDLEAQVADLRIELREAHDDLAASQHVNQQITRQLNSAVS